MSVALVERRAEVFRMAMAEATGVMPVVWVVGGTRDFEWEAVSDPRLEYRACILADMAYPIGADELVCFSCWEHWSYSGVEATRHCERVINLEALRFTPCRRADR